MPCTREAPCGTLRVDTQSLVDSRGARARGICPCGRSYWFDVADSPHARLRQTITALTARRRARLSGRACGVCGDPLPVQRGQQKYHSACKVAKARAAASRRSGAFWRRKRAAR